MFRIYIGLSEDRLPESKTYVFHSFPSFLLLQWPQVDVEAAYSLFSDRPLCHLISAQPFFLARVSMALASYEASVILFHWPADKDSQFMESWSNLQLTN